MKPIDKIPLPPLVSEPAFLYSDWLDDVVGKTITGMESADVVGGHRVGPLAVVRYGV